MTLLKFKNHPASVNLNRFMSDFFHPASFYKDDFEAGETHSSVPVNVLELQSGYQLEVAAPGFTKEDFKMNLDNNALVISAESKSDQPNENNIKYLRREFTLPSFQRSFSLDKNIDVDQISAEYINGILTVNLPKRPEVTMKMKQITVQ